MESNEVDLAFREYIEKHHIPPIIFTGNEEISIKHSITPGGRYLSARIEITQGKNKKDLITGIVFNPEDEEPTEAELEEHVKESAAAGEPIHPDQMIKNLMEGKK